MFIKKNLILSLFKGLILFTILILIWGFAYYFFEGCKFSNGVQDKPTLFDCIYYSCISFSTVGFGDIVPANNIGKIIIILESISSLCFVTFFSGYIVYQLLRRPKNVFFSEYFFLKYINDDIRLTFRFGNKGHDLVDCKIYINIIRFNDDYYNSIGDFTTQCSIIESSYFFSKSINDNEDNKFSEAFKFLYNNPKNSEIRLLFKGIDSLNSESILLTKKYTIRDLRFGGNFLPLYKNNLQSKNDSKPNWNNFNKANKISHLDIQKIDNFLKNYNC